MNNETSNLKIHQKYLELIYYSNDIVRKYPKCENFSLVQEMFLIKYFLLTCVLENTKLIKMRLSNSNLI